MSIFRDIGQTIGNILRPDGGPASLITAIPGLAAGSARAIAGAFNGNSATINPSIGWDDDYGDPTQTPLIKSFGVIKPGGPPYDNVLEQFASYNCVWTLCCLEPNQFNDPRTYKGNPKALKNVVISSAGRYDKQRVQTASGAPEFYIDNVVMKTKMSGVDAGLTNVTDLEFDVYEPYSMGLFFQSLQAAAIEAGYAQYLDNAPFLLKLEFMGFDDKGQIFSSTEELAKYITIRITESDMKVDEGGSRYKVKAKPFHHGGYTDGVNTVPGHTNITGSTVQEVLSSGKQSLMNQLNNIQFSLVDENLADKPDLYEIVFPTSWTDDVGLKGGISRDVLKAMVDINAGKQITAAASYDIDLVDFGQGEIGQSSMGFSATSGGNYLFKDAVDVVDPNTGRITRDSMTIDPTRRSFQFGEKSKITNIIKMIVLASEYCANALKPEAIDPKTGMVKWFKIDVQIELLEFDFTRNVRAKKYIYRVVPYMVRAEYLKNPTSASAGSEGREKIIAKRFDYIYSGQNNSILKLDLVYNGMFKTGALPRPPQKHSQVQNTNDQSAAETKRLAAQAQKGAAPESIGSETGTPSTKPDYSIKTGTASGEKNVQQIIADAFQRAWENGTTDMMNVKMEILGDPYFLSDSGICSKFLGEYGPNSQIMADGSMNWQGSEIFCYVTFRNPIEPNLGTTGKGGLFNFPKGQWVSPYSGIYQITGVENKWAGNVYTQSLEMNRMINQSIDYKGRAQIESRSQSLYETKEAPPPTGPIDTVVYGGDEGE